MDNLNNMEKDSQGPIIGVVLVVIVLVLGGLYMVFTRANQGPTALPTEENFSNLGPAMSSSTELEAIEQDASATAPANLEAELNQIGAGQ